MPGQRITVDRQAKRAGAEPRILLSMVRSAWRVARQLLRRPNETLALRFPEERRDFSAAFRGMPVLVERADGTPRCNACQACASACPTSCIEMASRANDAARLDRFDLDLSRCLFCGLCEEVCPEQAIVMSGEVEFASYDRASLRFAKEELLVPEALLAKRLAFLRGEATGSPDTAT